MMLSVTVREAENESIFQAISQRIKGQRRDIRLTRAPLGSAIYDAQVVVLSGTAARNLPKNREIECKILIAPSDAVPANAECEYIVSYGMGARDSITASSVSEKECLLALQRDIITLSGEFVDRQEIPVLRKNFSPEDLMAISGALLVMGVEPEKLSIK